jgi:hypothetical protein
MRLESHDFFAFLVSINPPSFVPWPTKTTAMAEENERLDRQEQGEGRKKLGQNSGSQEALRPIQSLLNELPTHELCTAGYRRSIKHMRTSQTRANSNSDNGTVDSNPQNFKSA